MIVLLPPSETKDRPIDGPPLELPALARPSLASARSAMLRAAARTATARGGGAALKVPASAPELVERMARLEEEPCARPLAVYSGVLYDALGNARPSADRRVLVTSALLGIVDADQDLIPAYRLSAGSTVSRLGSVGAWWRPHLAAVARDLARSGEVVVDCRSGAYRSMMPVPGAVHVVALRERDGVRTVVSHDAKRYRGLVARALLTADATARDAEDVHRIAAEGLPAGLRIASTPEVLTVIDAR